MVSENLAVSELKRHANILKLASSLVLTHSYNIESNEPLMHVPSLQQCIESMSHGYGFKSYNGFLHTKELNRGWDQHAFHQSILSHVREVNSLDSVGYIMATTWIGFDADEQWTKLTIDLFNYLTSMPFTGDLIMPNMIYTDMLNIADYQKDQGGQRQHLRLAEYVLSHVVDGLKDGTVSKSVTDQTTMYYVPLSVMYKHKILGDVSKAQSIIKYIVDEINLSGILSAHAGNTELINHHNSVINVVVDNKLAQEIDVFVRYNQVMEQLLGRFHDVLKIYPKPVIDFKQVNKLKGYDQVKYATFKYYLIMIFRGLLVENGGMHSLLGIEDELRVRIEKFGKKFDSVDQMAGVMKFGERQIIKAISLTNPHSHLINEAITKFDDCFARLIYPIFQKEREYLRIFKDDVGFVGNVKKASIEVPPSAMANVGHYFDDLKAIKDHVIRHNVNY